MAKLQQIISQILHRLRDVSPSQRLALLLGGLLVAVSLLWLVYWAASPELVPLLPQDLAPEELAQVCAGLEATGEPFETRGNRVYVKATDVHRVLALLQQQEKLPANTSIGFAALVKESDPWLSQEESNRRWTVALQKELEAVLAQFQGVRSASVFLNVAGSRPGFTKFPPPASASVTLVMKGGDTVPRPLALAAARLVSGAVAGLTPRSVQVLDAGGAAALDWDSELDPSSALGRVRSRIEQEFTEKIRVQVPDPRALVSVVVELNSTATTATEDTPVKGVPRSEETTSEETTRVARSEQPGVQPNVGLSAGGSAGGESRRQDQSRVDYETGRQTRSETTPAGDVKLVTAAISLSASYLENVFARAGGESARPTDAQLEEVFQRERARLLPQVVQLVRPAVPENVAISRYYDTSSEPAPAGPAGTLDATLALARQYGPQAGLGLLALVALGLTLRMARRTEAGESFGLELGLPKEAIEAARQAASDVATVTRTTGGPAGAHGSARGARAGGASGPAFAEADVVTEVGQAAVTEGLLVAQEVDAGTVQTRKMLNQVTDMVRSDPQIVAALLEQWIQKNEQYREGGA